MISSDASIHPQAIVEDGARVGPRTRVLAFAHIMPGATVGADCHIYGGVFVDNGAVVGDRVTVKPGVQLWKGVTIENDVLVGPNATFANDPPRYSHRPLESHPATLVREGALIGANATVLPGLVIGKNANVIAGAVITRNVPARAVVAGNPAKIEGYVDTRSVGEAIIVPVESKCRTASRLQVLGAELIELPEIIDLRGTLTFGQLGEGLPFQPKRYYMVYAVPGPEVRGEHAHRQQELILSCVHGSCSVMIDDGTCREEVRLSRPNLALHLTRMVWGIQYRFTADAVLLVLASEKYDPDDYIRDYDEFLALVGHAAG